MKTNKHLIMKRLATIAYICMALCSTLYAKNLSKKQIKCCENADQHAVTYTEPGGKQDITHDQYDCCMTGCMIANGGDDDKTWNCTWNCDPLGH